MKRAAPDHHLPVPSTCDCLPALLPELLEKIFVRTRVPDLGALASVCTSFLKIAGDVQKEVRKIATKPKARARVIDETTRPSQIYWIALALQYTQIRLRDPNAFLEKWEIARLSLGTVKLLKAAPPEQRSFESICARLPYLQSLDLRHLHSLCKSCTDQRPWTQLWLSIKALGCWNLLPFSVRGMSTDAISLAHVTIDEWNEKIDQLGLRTGVGMVELLIENWPGESLIAFGNALGDLFEFCSRHFMGITAQDCASAIAQKTQTLLEHLAAQQSKHVLNELFAAPINDAMQYGLASNAPRIFSLLDNEQYCQNFAFRFRGSYLAEKVAQDFAQWQSSRQAQ